MRDDVALERGGSAMQAAVDVSESIRAATVPGPPIVAFSDAGTLALILGFLVQLLQIRAHARQFLTSHNASISQRMEGQYGLRT
jgi:hypothetical protein